MTTVRPGKGWGLVGVRVRVSVRAWFRTAAQARHGDGAPYRNPNPDRNPIPSPKPEQEEVCKLVRQDVAKLGEVLEILPLTLTLTLTLT